MKLFNTASKKLEEFRPTDEKNVKIYTCGPTVYSTPHIGNYASYIYWDLLVRTLVANGYTPNRVLNLTDVGHLTSDGDEGEDKLEKGAKREGKTVWEIADFYINNYLEGFRELNLIEPDKICRATDYIEESMRSVDEMTKNGFTYETSDGIYFDTSKFNNYAKFARLDLENIKAGARVEFNNEKRNASDFAVWKFIKPGENHAMRWDYLGRPGYPGWHLECSTIINKELGEPIDIHTGGIDHIPVHHTNEIAQTFAISGKHLSNYWLHCNFITVDGQKISKSLGNGYTLADLKEKGFSPLDFKMWILQGHFQGDRNFTFEALEAAKNRRLNWKNRIALEFQKPHATADNFYKNLLESLNNNLNSADAFAKIDGEQNLSLDDWKEIDALFGLGLIDESKELTEAQEEILKNRKKAREEKDWKTSDELRTELEKQGITVKYTPDGQVWQYLK